MHELLAKLVECADSLDKESDRGCAVLAVALLEERLRESLKARLSTDEKQLSQFVPSGAVSRGVTLAKMVGLVTPEWEADWKLVLKIRNEFAHSAAAGISFDNAPIAPLVRDLKVIPLVPDQSNRTRFLWVVNALYSLLTWLSLNAGPIPKPVVSFWRAT